MDDRKCHIIPEADPGFYKGDSFIINVHALIFEAMPNFALTTPIFDQRPRVLSHLSRLKAGRRPEIVYVGELEPESFFAVSEVGGFDQV